MSVLIIHPFRLLYQPHSALRYLVRHEHLLSPCFRHYHQYVVLPKPIDTFLSLLHSVSYVLDTPISSVHCM